MTLTEARDFLRAELLTVAAAAVPGFEGIVAHDVGPVDPGVMSDGSGPDTVCSITIENGNPSVVDPAGEVAAAVAALAARGWQTNVAPVENGHHRATAQYNGFQVTVHGWDDDWRLTLSGETPSIPE